MRKTNARSAPRPKRRNFDSINDSFHLRFNSPIHLLYVLSTSIRHGAAACPLGRHIYDRVLYVGLFESFCSLIREGRHFIPRSIICLYFLSVSNRLPENPGYEFDRIPRIIADIYPADMGYKPVHSQDKTVSLRIIIKVPSNGRFHHHFICRPWAERLLGALLHL